MTSQSLFFFKKKCNYLTKHVVLKVSIKYKTENKL